MGFFNLFGSNRRSRDEDRQLAYEKALVESERAESILILDKLQKDFWAMGEFQKSSKYDVMNFMAKQLSENELFNSDGVRPGLIHAREIILRKMEELGGLISTKEKITKEDIWRVDYYRAEW